MFVSHLSRLPRRSRPRLAPTLPPPPPPPLRYSMLNPVQDLVTTTTLLDNLDDGDRARVVEILRARMPIGAEEMMRRLLLMDAATLREVEAAIEQVRRK